MLKVELAGRDLEINEEFAEYVERKAGKLDKYLSSLKGVRVELRHAQNARDPQDRHVAQITAEGKGFDLRSEERSDEIRRAFDTALQKIERQIERYKGKRYRGKGDGASLADAGLKEVEEAYAEEAETEIVRRKKFLLRPMDPQEALEQMRLLGHDDFFVFFNMDANCVSLLYQRRDGRYGLIDTELA